MEKIKVLVVDDHPMLRGGVIALLEKVENFLVCCEATNGQEAIRCMENSVPDVVLMDINMEGRIDVDTTRTIKERWPAVKVIAFSMHQEVQVIRRMLKAGASGYILKSASHQDMIKGINAVVNGNSYFDQDVLDIMTQSITADEEELPEDVALSNREREVLFYVAKEYTNQEIADTINISLRTVETHKRNLIKKLRVKNVVGLVRYALDNGQMMELPEV